MRENKYGTQELKKGKKGIRMSTDSHDLDFERIMERDSLREDLIPILQ